MEGSRSTRGGVVHLSSSVWENVQWRRHGGFGYMSNTEVKIKKAFGLLMIETT